MKKLLLAALITSAAAALGAEDRLAQGNNEFALNLYRQLATNQTGNLFFSPYSISSALAMTYAGAKGETAGQMAQVLRFQESGDPLHAEFAKLSDSLNAESKSGRVALSVANALWGQKGFGFRKDFLERTRRYYGAGLHELDFSNAERACRVINNWVEKATRGKITKLLSPDVLGGARLVLTNAIYFKGNWISPFKKTQTKEQPFHLETGQDVAAPLMHQTTHGSYLETPEFQALELPYEGNRLGMLILLPKNSQGLKDLEKKLGEENLADWMTKLAPREVEIFLPKFKANSRFELGPALTALGMGAAFDPDKADFSGMDGKRDLFISKVIHKAFVDVNEEGAEAAAATAVIMVRAAAVSRWQKPPVFRADHPFLYFIRDKTTGALLFAGRLDNPKD